MSDTAIVAAPLVALVQPWVAAAAGVIVPAIIAWGVNAFVKMTHAQINAADEAALEKAAATKAGELIAAAADNLATAQLHVGSPIIAAAVKDIEDYEPAVAAMTGYTPDKFASLLTGELGKLQARMTAVAPQPAPAKA